MGLAFNVSSRYQHGPYSHLLPLPTDKLKACVAVSNHKRGVAQSQGWCVEACLKSYLGNPFIGRYRILTRFEHEDARDGTRITISWNCRCMFTKPRRFTKSHWTVSNIEIPGARSMCVSSTSWSPIVASTDTWMATRVT